MDLPELVIFDMDGTILDTEAVSLLAFGRVARALGEEMPPEFFRSFMGRNAAAAKRLFDGRFGGRIDFAEAFAMHQGFVDRHMEENGVPVKKGLAELLDGLERRGVKKCVATSTARAAAEKRLAKAGLLPRFMLLVCGDEVRESKPDPEIFQKAAALCGARSEKSLVVEDSAAGALAAAAAGIPYVIVPDLAPLPDWAREGALAVCAELGEILGLFGRNGGWQK